MSVNIFIYMLDFNLKEVLHTTLFFMQCYIIFEKVTLHHLLYEYCCPLSHLLHGLLYI